MRAELMRYRNDSISYYLTLLGLALDAVYLMLLYSSAGIPANDEFGFIIGVDTIYNIVFMLMAFYAAEKVKTYSMNWCFVSGGLGVLQIPRILLPVAFNNAQQLVGAGYIASIILLGVSAVSMMLACYTSFVKSRRLNGYLKELKNSEVA